MGTVMSLLPGITRARPRPVDSFLELGAYETLWLEAGATWKSLADRFRDPSRPRPSDHVVPELALENGARTLALLEKYRATPFGVRIHGAGEYPPKLRDARHPVELLYYRGFWELVELPSVAIVGTRKPSDDGVARARRLARDLVEAGKTIVSGLAAGIDTAAHEGALMAKGRTIAVIGTSIAHVYPRENAQLQAKLANEHLVISQVPVLRYESQGQHVNRFFFPERNVTMSALTGATIIVEAGETSGTLTQAKAAIHQGRKLFILNSCFERGLAWPAKLEAQGAIRVRSTSDILDALK